MHRKRGNVSLISMTRLPARSIAFKSKCLEITRHGLEPGRNRRSSGSVIEKPVPEGCWFDEVIPKEHQRA
ncbi:hypothetical protein SGCOL_000348 [Colletotrichum sp. CLE4]